MKPTIIELEKYTNEFFDIYWKTEFGERPTWSDEWQFRNEVPNRKEKGCYALFDSEEVSYVGKAVGRGKLDDGGIGQRVSDYWKKGNDQYAPTEKNKTWLTSIRTIPFPSEHFYLALALEVFLIRKLSPRRNTSDKLSEVTSDTILGDISIARNEH